MRLTVRLISIVTAGLIVVSLLGGCSTKPPQSGKPKEAQPEPDAKKPAGPPTLADVEGYQQWLKFNRQPVEGRTHGLTNIYTNQDRAVIAPDGRLKFPFPDGTVIVKEVVSSGWVAIMRKEKGSDSAHRDWQWIEYKQDGSVAGQDGACWGCHGGAESTDYVFTDLEE